MFCFFFDLSEFPSCIDLFLKATTFLWFCLGSLGHHPRIRNCLVPRIARLLFICAPALCGLYIAFLLVVTLVILQCFLTRILHHTQMYSSKVGLRTLLLKCSMWRSSLLRQSRNWTPVNCRDWQNMYFTLSIDCCF